MIYLKLKYIFSGKTILSLYKKGNKKQVKLYDYMVQTPLNIYHAKVYISKNIV